LPMFRHKPRPEFRALFFHHGLRSDVNQRVYSILPVTGSGSPMVPLHHARVTLR
jgi:hypothetical protein